MACQYTEDQKKHRFHHQQPENQIDSRNGIAPAAAPRVMSRPIPIPQRRRDREKQSCSSKNNIDQFYGTQSLPANYYLRAPRLDGNQNHRRLLPFTLDDEDDASTVDSTPYGSLREHNFAASAPARGIRMKAKRQNNNYGNNDQAHEDQPSSLTGLEILRQGMRQEHPLFMLPPPQQQQETIPHPRRAIVQDDSMSVDDDEPFQLDL